jgi:hypothetical protein
VERRADVLAPAPVAAPARGRAARWLSGEVALAARWAEGLRWRVHLLGPVALGALGVALTVALFASALIERGGSPWAGPPAS